MKRQVATRKALLFIFVTAFLDSTGLGIIIPVTPELIMELTDTSLGSAATLGGGLLFIYALMQFFFAPIMGNLSDRFGRRPVLLLSLFTFGADYVLMGLATTFYWLVAGRLLSGISGASFTTANAYIADVSPPEERAQNFGVIGAAFGFGFILGPVIGGLLGAYGARVPFFAAAGLAMLNMLYGYFVLPESLPPERRRPFELSRANPLGALVQMRRFPIVIGLGAVLFLYQIAHDANPSVWTYYTMLKFDWSERDVGYSLGCVGLGIAFVQGYLIRVVIPRIGAKRSVHLGLLATAVGFAGFGSATEGWMMLCFIVPYAMGGLAIPALRGLMSNQVPDNAQGELQGALTSIVSLTAIIAPLIMTQLFGFFTSEAAPVYLPGAPFMLAAGLVVASVLLFLKVTPPGQDS